MPSLLEAAKKVFDAPTLSEISDNLLNVEKTLREDTDNSIARTLIQMIDQNQIETLKDMEEFQSMVYDYEASKESERVMSGGMSYDFEPPKSLMDEFGIAQEPGGKTVIRENGQAYEVRFNGPDLDKIGPVDDDGNPLAGHPDYVAIQEISPLTQGLWPVEKSGEFLSNLEKQIEPNLDHLLSVTSSIDDFSQDTMPEPIKLKIASVYLRNVGRIDYEVLDILYSRYCVVLIFDPNLSKPPFYPEVGLRFEFEFQGKISQATYAGVVFPYNGLKFMSFILLDKEE